MTESPDVREARRIVAAHECRLHGHSWEFIYGSSPYPRRIYCERACGAPILDVVQPPDRPRRDAPATPSNT